MDIELVEALCGYQKIVRTLDDRDLVISSNPGDVTKHADVKFVPNEGAFITFYNLAFVRIRNNIL